MFFFLAYLIVVAYNFSKDTLWKQNRTMMPNNDDAGRDTLARAQPETISGRTQKTHTRLDAERLQAIVSADLGSVLERVCVCVWAGCAIAIQLFRQFFYYYRL